jgi:hypothetical protein
VSDDEKPRDDPRPPKAVRGGRQARVADALRANLRRRKQAERRRADEASEG